jgi:hypothetical protein
MGYAHAATGLFDIFVTAIIGIVFDFAHHRPAGQAASAVPLR